MNGVLNYLTNWLSYFNYIVETNQKTSRRGHTEFVYLFPHRYQKTISEIKTVLTSIWLVKPNGKQLNLQFY